MTWQEVAREAIDVVGLLGICWLVAWVLVSWVRSK